jgi:hypothetical protein
MRDILREISLKIGNKKSIEYNHLVLDKTSNALLNNELREVKIYKDEDMRTLSERHIVVVDIDFTLIELGRGPVDIFVLKKEYQKGGSLYIER